MILLLVAGRAFAVPSFARQTGLFCNVCHSVQMQCRNMPAITMNDSDLNAAIAPILVAGPIVGSIVAELKRATVFGSISVVGAGLFSIGIPTDSIMK